MAQRHAPAGSCDASGKKNGGQFRPSDAKPQSRIDIGAHELGNAEQAQIDDEIAKAYGAMMDLLRRRQTLLNTIYEIEPRARMSADELRAKYISGEIGRQAGYFRDYYLKVFEECDRVCAALDDAQKTYATKSADYGGWSRFYLVPDGHIHSSLSCPTCNKNGAITVFQWLTDLSGLAESDAVAEHGAILCTVCFPSAPVEYTNKYDLEREAKLAQRCPSSGDLVQTHENRMAIRCPSCGACVRVTPSGCIRAHDKRPLPINKTNN